MATILELPSIIGWQAANFDPVRPRLTDRMQGRRTESIIHGTPWWIASYRAPWVDRRDYGRMDAFMMRAGDNGEVFRAYDPERPRPMAHDTGKPLTGTRAGGGAFDGTATITSRTATTLNVTGLPALFQFRLGDYVEVRKSATLISLHRIQADVQASAGGGVTLPIRYALDLQNFTVPLTANFERAACLMQMDPGSYKGTKSRRDRAPSFSAQEVFVP